MTWAEASWQRSLNSSRASSLLLLGLLLAVACVWGGVLEGGGSGEVVLGIVMAVVVLVSLAVRGDNA
jgi:hypothetical protein